MSLFIPPIATVRLPHLVSVLATAATAVRRHVTRFVRGWRRRHEALMLARADDHILADLGLSRGDMRDAFSGPPWDPTALLRARALERRLARHRLVHGFPPLRSARPAGPPSVRPSDERPSRPQA